MSGHKGIGSHTTPNQGDKEEWITPREVTDALGPFDLDPCAPVNPPWPIATLTYNLHDDGLHQPWSGFVWCNPPYTGRVQTTGRWLQKMRRHGRGIALIFARTETEMFFEGAWNGADSMLFLEGRLTFHHVDGRKASHNSGGPSVLLSYGQEAMERLAHCDLAGAHVERWIARRGKTVGTLL